MLENGQLFLGQPKSLGQPGADDRGRVLHCATALPLPNRHSVQPARNIPGIGKKGCVFTSIEYGGKSSILLSVVLEFLPQAMHCLDVENRQIDRL